MPTPNHINEQSLPYTGEIVNQIMQLFNEFALGNTVSYSDINRERVILEEAYDKLVNSNVRAKFNISQTDRTGMNSLDYPTKERFILEKGEYFLGQNFFEGDLSTYTFFAAITNQFLNCRLESIFFDTKIQLPETNYRRSIYDLYKNFAFQHVPPPVDTGVVCEFEEIYDEYSDIEFPEFKEEPYYDYYSGYEILESILHQFSIKEVMIGERKATTAELLDIKRYLLLFVLTKGNVDNIRNILGEKDLKDSLTHRYFASCINHSQIGLHEDENRHFLYTEMGSKFYIDFNIAIRVEYFKKIRVLVDLIESEIAEQGMILSNKASDNFRQQFNTLNIEELTRQIVIYDKILNEGFIPFADSFNKTNDKAEYLFKTLISSMFKKNEKTIQCTINGKRERFYYNVSRISDSLINVNLLYPRVPELTL